LDGERESTNCRVLWASREVDVNVSIDSGLFIPTFEDGALGILTLENNGAEGVLKDVQRRFSDDLESVIVNR
jgi:hypothetical protein